MRGFYSESTLCPTSTTPKVCPRRASIEVAYAYPSTYFDIDDLPEKCHPRHDAVKRLLALGEQEVVAIADGCAGPVDGQCPVYVQMHNSLLRKSVLLVGRRILNMVRTT